MQGQQGRNWFLGQANASTGVPGYAFQPGTGQQLPLRPILQPRGQARPIRKGG